MIKRLKSIPAFILCLMAILPDPSFAQPNKGGRIRVDVNGIQLQLEFYTAKIIRVIKSKEAVGMAPDHYYILASPQNVKIGSSVKGSLLIYKTDNLELDIDKNTGAVSFAQNGKTLLREDPAFGFTPLANKPGFYRIKQGFLLDKDEPVYGLGQHQKGTMDQRNQELILQQANKEVAIPVFQSLKGYGVLWNNETPTLFSDTLRHTYFLSDQGKTIDYFFIAGNSPDSIVAGLRYLTGPAPMPPHWAFGYFQSRERYKSQREVLDVVQRYRDLHVPLDCIVQDWQYWGTDENSWNALKFDNPAFSRPGDLMDSLHKMSAHIIISVWPSFGPATDAYRSYDEGGLLYPGKYTNYPKHGARIYNAFNKTGRDIYWSYINKNIFSLGIDGWWSDATEPTEGDHSSSIQLLQGSPDTIAAIPNSYPLYHNSGIYNNQRKTSEDKRVLILTRSGFTGQQHYGAFVWSGDIGSDWSIMKDQISGGLNIGLSGIPYWNTDIGGFFSYPKGIADTAWQELYVRWLELGTFFPLMRSHGTVTPREIYQFGKEGDWAYDAIKKFITLRYRLLPYNYSTAYQVTANGASFMRPLFADFVKDKATNDINDEFLFGNSLLIAPVTESQYIDRTDGNHKTNFSQKRSRKLYLPAGSDWYDFWNNAKQAGGQWLERETPIDIIPIFVKAGAILPFAREKQYADESKDDVLEINIYPGANGKFILYEDEGTNYNYEKGKYSTIGFEWDDKTQQLFVAEKKGSFSGELNNRQFKIHLIAKNRQRQSVEKTINYVGKAVKLNF